MKLAIQASNDFLEYLPVLEVPFEADELEGVFEDAEEDEGLGGHQGLDPLHNVPAGDGLPPRGEGLLQLRVVHRHVHPRDRLQVKAP